MSTWSVGGIAMTLFPFVSPLFSSFHAATVNALQVRQHFCVAAHICMSICA